MGNIVIIHPNKKLSEIIVGLGENVKHLKI